MRHLILFISLCTGIAIGKNGFGPTDQEWGFVTVRKNAHLFWWLHYTTAEVANYTDRPLLIWLQGGPGSSSTAYGNFFELGPLDENLNPRNTSWVKYANLLFVDNPVGTGFSYVDDNNAFTTTNEEIGNDFVQLLKGFYEAVPEMKKVPLYIFSESYGGKMTAEIALATDKAVKVGLLDCNLKGIGLGDSWISPISSVLTWAPYLKSVGIIDEHGYEMIMQKAKIAESLLNEGQYTNATYAWGNAEGAIVQATYGVDFYNILKKMPNVEKTVPSYKRLISHEDEREQLIELMKKVQTALNITRTWGNQSDHVFEYLKEDFMKPVTITVEKLLNDTNITVAVYNGQLDLIVDVIGTLQWVDNMNWKYSSQWKARRQKSFVSNKLVEGYKKIVGNLQFYLALRAGHMVPADNPDAMHYILKTVTNNFTV